jgi:hypothetical protein
VVPDPGQRVKLLMLNGSRRSGFVASGLLTKGSAPSSSPYRIFMQRHRMQDLGIGAEPGLWGVSSPVRPGLCRIVDMDLREH